MERKSGNMDRKSGSMRGHSDSRGPSRMKGSGVFFDPLYSRSSRSFMGSKTSLFSGSKRNLASESVKGFSKLPQLMDEDGCDVTPVSLLQQDHSVAKKSQFTSHFMKGETPNASIFQSSVFGSHTTAGPGQSVGQPFSRSIYSTSATDLGTSSLSVSMIDEFKTIPTKAEGSEMSHLEPSDSLEGPREVTAEDLEKEVEIALSETETIFMLDIPGTCVAMDTEEYNEVKESNEKYELLVKGHTGNDNYMERSVQTINDACKVKQVQTDAIRSQEAGTSVSTWDMYNTYEMLKAEEASHHEEETLEELSSRAASRMTAVSRMSGSVVMSRVPTSTGDRPTEDTRVPGESSIQVSMIESTGGSDDPNPNAVPRRKREEDLLDPTVPNNHPVLKSENLMNTFRTVERVITQNIYHPKQAMYRDVEPMEDPDYPASGVNINLSTPHLDKLWTYSCSLTKRRKVTCMAWNNSNQDIIAVGYGTFKANEDCMGLICCWSLKNPEFPERVFHAPSGITSLSFSQSNPNLLAAGLFNGNIVLYNARSDLHESVLDSSDALHKHSGPVWQINWITKEHSLGESKSENLISISVDGHILQWSIRKGFESTQLMNLKRMVSNKQATVKKSRSKLPIVVGHTSKHAAIKNAQMAAAGSSAGEAYISQHAPGMGFDFWPSDTNIYLACTDEGFIHKCSCSYNEQVLETYVGHTGPVYRVSWSPFVKDYFLSCSADWSVKLWAQDKTTPIQSFCVAQKSVNDVCWSPFSSTIFGCVSEGRVEIWNLDYSNLDPLIVHRPLSAATLTCLTFAHNSKVVLVGDTEGDVSVYLLSNLPIIPSSHEDSLLAAISSMSKNDNV